MKAIKAFTLMELVIVIVILSIISSFGIPSFIKTVNRSKARNAINNLSIIHSLNSNYRNKFGYNIFSGNIASVNTQLELNILSDGLTYNCGSGTTCVASMPSVFSATVTLGNVLAAGNPSCTNIAANVCP